MNTCMYMNVTPLSHIKHWKQADRQRNRETNRETDIDLRWHWLEVGSNVFPSSHLIQSARLVVPFMHTRHAGTASEHITGMTKKEVLVFKCSNQTFFGRPPCKNLMKVLCKHYAIWTHVAIHSTQYLLHNKRSHLAEPW